ncbi:cyclase family protein [Virgifigura deserti]|uniref:cyclase family protein n=1 Tax=Virgifigura deserti TaxID=2268457 RepID=UPI003CCBA4C0
MKHEGITLSRIRGALCTAVMLTALADGGSAALAQGGDWYPSPWGPEDERGAANRLTPAKVLEAKNLIERGQVYQLGRVYQPDMPFFGERSYEMRILEVGPLAKNQLRAHEGYFSGELDQVGTQFDALGHIGIGDRFFNGYHHSDLGDEHGLAHLGVEHVGPIVSRGVLIDVAGYKGLDRLEAGYEITVADLKGALERQGTEINEGDAVLIHTGWGSHWAMDNAKYYGAGPGIGLEAAQFLVDEKIVVVGSDNAGVEVVPNPDPSLVFPVHQLFLAQNGIYLLESIITEELAQDGAYEFAFIFAPLRLKGASGSPGNPIAIH